MTQERHAQQGLPDFKLHDPSDPQHEPTRRGTVRRARIATSIIVFGLLLGLAGALYARYDRDQQLDVRVAENGKLYVRVISPSTDANDAKLTLPATLQGTMEAQIFARATGYVKQWRKDIGATVKKGEVLATLDLPEINRQVEEAAATHALAKSAYERWRQLRADDAVSQQELDEKTAAYRQTEAVLKRLREQLAFGQVVAPFDGTLTRRNVNQGDLVNAGNGGSAQALFSIAHVEKLRAYVYLPQDRTAQVKVGDEVELNLLDRPGQPVKAKIARTAGAIDLATRTLQIEVEVNNADRKLLPGAYAEVAFKLDARGQLLLPTNVLLFGASGPQVAVVTDGKVSRRSVTLGTDYGKTVAVRKGVSATDRIIINPPDAVADGQAVVVEASAKAAAGGAAGGGGGGGGAGGAGGSGGGAKGAGPAGAASGGSGANPRQGA